MLMLFAAAGTANSISKAEAGRSGFAFSCCAADGEDCALSASSLGIGSLNGSFGSSPKSRPSSV
ncbi:hypothetical protein [Gordoniibacillus kamchatkensis]|uniref:hypothetical protein n=1 Tax=Gordoniibacillus kamchatkensis TaxID=1590651 RepID=UPI0006961B89|nr:hypothetical protein [Paenibacillus sp. VKM B-2647]